MQKNLTNGPIPKLIRQLAVPASIGFFFNTMYNVVDTYYGGLISTEALAALSLSFPIFFIILALGTGIGTGATALIGNSLGEKKKQKAKQYAMQSISFSIWFGLILTIIGLIISPTLFRILGADSQYLNLSLQYMNVILYGTIFFMLVYAFNAVLNSQGDTVSFRNFLIFGFILNLILDPALMFGWFFLPKLGLAGVAWATTIIQAIGAIYLGIKASKTGLLDKKYSWIKPDKKIYKDISKQGFPAGLNMMTVALGIFIITYFLSIFGKSYVAGYGIATRIEQIVLMPTIGLNIATLAIVGQNNGAKKFHRIKEVLSKSIKYGIIISSIGYVFVFIFAESMMRFFTPDITVIDIGAVYLRIAAFISFAYVILFVNVSALQGVKKPMFALYIGFFRQIAAPLILFPIATSYFGILGLWGAIFIIVWVGAIITIFYSRHVINGLYEKNRRIIT